MRYTTLISAASLRSLLATDADVLLVDCTADLARPEAGGSQFLAAHIPTAIHADLEHDLSVHGDTPAASGGRHPLPAREAVAQWASSVGLKAEQQVVVYDRNGLNFCVRLWWMLKWMGHDHVAVLDGGLAAWQAAGGALEAGPARGRPAGDADLLRPSLRVLTTVDQVHLALGSPAQTLIDARATPRYKGEVEPLDPVAGHIPGALNRPFASNLDEHGFFKEPAQLRAEFEALLKGRDPASVVHYCGSGVSALPNLLAMEVAGFAPTALFAGSWSEWCREPSRPVEKG